MPVPQEAIASGDNYEEDEVSQSESETKELLTVPSQCAQSKGKGKQKELPAPAAKAPALPPRPVQRATPAPPSKSGPVPSSKATPAPPSKSSPVPSSKAAPAPSLKPSHPPSTAPPVPAQAANKSQAVPPELPADEGGPCPAVPAAAGLHHRSIPPLNPTPTGRSSQVPPPTTITSTTTTVCGAGEQGRSQGTPPAAVGTGQQGQTQAPPPTVGAGQHSRSQAPPTTVSLGQHRPPLRQGNVGVSRPTGEPVAMAPHRPVPIAVPNITTAPPPPPHRPAPTPVLNTPPHTGPKSTQPHCTGLDVFNSFPPSALGSSTCTGDSSSDQRHEQLNSTSTPVDRTWGQSHGRQPKPNVFQDQQGHTGGAMDSKMHPHNAYPRNAYPYPYNGYTGLPPQRMHPKQHPHHSHTDAGPSRFAGLMEEPQDKYTQVEDQEMLDDPEANLGGREFDN
ncbi:hypothetical protein DXG01_001551, partial [Tephrocybe rancida]